MQFHKLFLLVAGALGLACAPLCAQAAPSSAASAPAPTSVSQAPQKLPAARVKQTLADYQRWLNRVAQRDAVAGLATAVVIDGKVVYEGTIGYTDATTKDPITPHTVFRLASLSKAFATAITGLLVDDGKLGWDTKLLDVLPYFKLKDMQAAAQATVGDILGQRLGLPRFFYHQVDKRIFYPLGMTTASYGRAALESSKSWARPHRGSSRGWIPFDPNETYYRVAPAAGVNASIRDMEKWLIAQMGGRPDVLPPSLLDVLHAPGVSTPSELHATPWRRARLADAHYALGWRVYEYGGETLIYHAGAVAGYRTMIGFFPKYRAGVVTLWNSTGPTPSGLMPMVLDDLLGLPHVDWAEIEGPAKAAAPTKARNPKHRPRARHRPARKH